MDKINWVILNRVSNFIASIFCYVIMPLSPFVFEFVYTKPHEIALRSVIIAVSTYSFSTAFGTKFRVISVSLIVLGFFAGAMYGSVDAKDLAGFLSFPIIVLYFIIGLSLTEWAWRHFIEDEECLFYMIFQKK